MPSDSPAPAAFAGHYWTVAAWAKGALRRAGPLERGALSAARAWAATVHDERWGALRISGSLHAPEGARSVLVCVHGLGGDADSRYLWPALAAATGRGWACLRISLRGADGSGEGFYHAGLSADLHAALASPELARFGDVYVLGYSLGGHLALRLASEAHDARVRAVAAVCAPIDLARAVLALDAPACWPYRRYVLRRLMRGYAAVARRHPLPTPLAAVLGVRSLRQWDERTVVPHYCFRSADDYYARASVAGRLTELRVPALLVNAEHDPMVPARTVRPALPSSAPQLDVRWLRAGGHVGFPAQVDLGEAAPRGLEWQVVSWLERARRRGAGAQ